MSFLKKDPNLEDDSSDQEQTDLYIEEHKAAMSKKIKSIFNNPDLGKKVSGIAGSVKDKAGNVVGTVADTATNVAGNVAEKAGAAGETIASSRVGEAAGVAFGAAKTAGGKVVDAVAPVAVDAITETVHKASDAANEVATTIKENSPSARRKKARIDGFEHGIYQGAYLLEEDLYNFHYAYIAMLCFTLRSDGVFSDEEKAWLEGKLDHLKYRGGLPDEVKQQIMHIAENESSTFEDVRVHLDKVGLKDVDHIMEGVQLAIAFDEEGTDEERAIVQLLEDYLVERTLSGDDSPAAKMISESVLEYEGNIDQIHEKFKKRTKLQGSDYAFLTMAILLQVTRVVIINKFTHIEKAGGTNKKEKSLHSAQDKVLEKFSKGENESPYKLHASMEQIITRHGVPYDATYGGKDILSGANHRFSTLGHDPVLGLIFGTSNIMTNTITYVEERGFGIKIPETKIVDYKPGPIIEGEGGLGLTVEMLAASGERIKDEPSAAAAALIKQIIHIGTDLYTPKGIQIPFSNIILDKAHVDKLTSYISMGDILKVGAQAGLAVLINWLIAAIHGCTLVFKDDGERFSDDLHRARTNKIILISNVIATSSSAIQAAITKNPRNLDIGGAIVLATRLLSNAKFMAKLEEEYLNSGLDDIYKERAKGILE